MQAEEKGIHSGHRARMRAKLREHGERIFDTYELLEMLLYSVIPQRDTNPIAKGLLGEAGSLDGLLSRSEEELLSMSGIGARTARLLHLVGEADAVGSISSSARPRYTFDNYSRAGGFFVKHMKEHREVMATMLFFDNSMRLIGVKNIVGDRFGSAETRARFFIDAALGLGATIALLGFTHRTELVYPYDSDLATCRMLFDELSGVGVSLLDCYLVSSTSFASVGPQVKFSSMPSPEVERFCATRIPELRKFGERFEVGDNLSCFELEFSVKPSYGVTGEYLRELLDFVGAGDNAYSLLDVYGSLDTLISRGYFALCSHIGERGATLLSLVGALTSRRHTDLLRFGKPATPEELVKYLIYYGYSSPNESVYVMSLDRAYVPIACDYLGEGTVNLSEIYPRKIIECALRRRADGVIIAHNHPGGTAQPSEVDLSSTARLYSTLIVSGVKLRSHVIVAERDHFVLAPDEDGERIIRVGRIF